MAGQRHRKNSNNGENILLIVILSTRNHTQIGTKSNPGFQAALLANVYGTKPERMGPFGHLMIKS